MWWLSVSPALLLGVIRLEMGQEMGVLVGQVLTPDGKPAAEAKVWLIVHHRETDRHTVESTALTDTQGHFRLPYKTSLAIYTVVAHKQGFAIGEKDFDPREGKPLTVRLNRTAPLKGITLTPDGKPLAGAKVRVIFIHSDSIPIWLAGIPPEEVTPLWTTTDSEGRFTLENLPESAEVKLMIEHPDFSPSFFPPLSLPFLIVRTGSENLVLVVAPKSVLKGQLTMNGKPIAGQVICTGGIYRWMTTDEQGQFEGVLTPGRWFVWAIAEGGRWQCEPQSVTIVPGGTTTVSLQPTRTVEVRGKVVDAQTHKPVPSAEIYADRLVTLEGGYQEWWRPQVVKADNQGNFRLFLLPGKWTLSAWASYKPGHHIEVFKELEITKEMTITLELRKRPTVRVQVVDEKGKPVSHAILTRNWSTQRAGERGQVEFPSFEGRIVAITPDLQAFGEAEVKPDTKSIQIVVRKGVPVRGQVSDENGKPVPKAQIVVSALRYEPQIQHELPDEWFTVTADEQGHFQFCLPPGQKVILTAYAPGFFPTPTEIFAADPQKSPMLSVRLKRPNFTYEGVVVDARTGQPIYGAVVGISLSLPTGGRSFSEHTNCFTFTDRQGRFQFTGLLKERLSRLSVYHPAYEEYTTYFVGPGSIIPSRIQLRHPTPSPELAIGKSAPPLSDVRWLDGDAPSLQGKRTYLLFAIPFDPACERVMERLKAQQAKAPNAIQVLVIFDASLPPDEVRRYAQEKGLPFRIGTVPEGGQSGWDSETFRRYGVQSVPMLVIVDEQGIVEAINPMVE